MILKDAYTYQNIESPEFPKYMWMNVKIITFDDTEVSVEVGSDFIPCTVDNFDGDQAQYDQLSKGLPNSIFCPTETSKLSMLNLINQSKKSKGVFMDIVTCLSENLPDGTACVTDKEET